ncbi:MAG: ATP-dependent Clp protease proteolytic subunit [Candidatus Riflebacteria bacterium]|nr:ATP-dependent Clp protease proteolytic subunit [Candidatus Riflebacteria bacterium]
MKPNSKFRTFARQKQEIKQEGNTIYLYGVIGDWFDDLEAKRIIEKINAVSGDLTIHLNSPGGDVFDGIAVMNAIKSHGNTTIIIDGLAASIASVIAMSADKIIMSEGSFLMIHNPWTMMAGESKDFRHTADVLDKIRDEIANIYSRKTGTNTDEIIQAMNTETWYSAEEAKKLGLTDEIMNVSAKNNLSGLENFDFSVFNNVPGELKIAAKANKPKTIRDLEKILHCAGFSRSEAKAVASSGFGALENQREADIENSEKLTAALEYRKNIFKEGEIHVSRKSSC